MRNVDDEFFNDREERAADLFSRMNNVQRARILYSEYLKLKMFLEEPSEMDEVRASMSSQIKNIRKIYSAANIFRNALGEFEIKPLHLDDEILYLACICSRVYEALRFIRVNQFCIKDEEILANSADILKFNPYKKEFEEVIYDINYHQQNLQEIQKMISNLSGHRWESVRNSAFALAAALVVASVAVGLTVGTGGVILPVLLSAATISAGIGFFAAKDSGIAKSVRQLELHALEFPSVR